MLSSSAGCRSVARQAPRSPQPQHDRGSRAVDDPGLPRVARKSCQDGVCLRLTDSDPSDMAFPPGHNAAKPLTRRLAAAVTGS